MKTRLAFVLPFACAIGCGSPTFDAIPASVDVSHAPQQTIEITAQDFEFTPDEIHVKQGTLVTLKLKSIDGHHGFGLKAFGIDVDLSEGAEQSVQFYAGEKGEFAFRCTHFCGIGHLSMNGTIDVD